MTSNISEREEYRDSKIDEMDDDPLTLFISMLNAPESKRQYPKRLQVFFNFLGLSVGNNKNDLAAQARFFISQFIDDDIKNRNLQKQLIIFAGYQKQRVSNNELSPSTIPNYFKAIKLFCQANNLDTKVNWKIVSKSYPKGSQAANDRAPTLEEIQKILEFPDRRIKPLVLTLVSSGIRIGAFENLRWKHILPITNDSGNLIAAKIRVYPGDTEEYYSFLSPEAYTLIKDWMGYRSSCGETINGDSWVMRDIWQSADIEGIKNPKPLNSHSITRLLNRAWQAQKVRPRLPEGEKRHEFKTAHGFRKYFKTQLEQARVPSIKVEILLGHSLGISDSYAKFTEDQMLSDYLQGVEYLAVNQTVLLVNKSLKKQEEVIHKSLKELEDKHRKELDALHGKYSNDLQVLREDMEEKFERIMSKVDTNKL